MSTKESAERGSKVTAEQIRSFGGCNVALYYEQKFLNPHEGHGCLTQFSGTQGATA